MWCQATRIKAAMVFILSIASYPPAWAIGPSFDCRQAQSAAQQLVCASPELSRIDMEYVQTYYAMRQQIGEAGWQAFKRQTIASQNETLRFCGIPLSGPLLHADNQMLYCFGESFKRQRTAWLALLGPPASQEAKRPIEQHISLQRELKVLGFLSADAQIDGIYGLATRNAILAWQHTKGRLETGFIDDRDATALLIAPVLERETTIAAPATPTQTARPNDLEHIVQQWTGSTSMTTRPFHIDGPWELQWTSSDGYFSIHRVRLDGKEQLVANQSAGENSSSYQPDGGDYFLKVRAHGQWTIKIVSVLPAVGPVTLTDRTPPQPNPPTDLPKQVPSDEDALIQIVGTAISQYKNGTNELQQGAARPMRARAICGVISSRRAVNWIGTISRLSTNGEGRGVLAIQIASHISVKTWNNAISDTFDKTLIDFNSSLFSSLTKLREGQKVRFNGQFLPSDTDCIEESSLTLRGSIFEPEFIIKYESVAPID